MAEALSMLIVDEDEAMNAMLRRFLTRQEVDAHTVTRVADAEALMLQYTFQLVLTDLFQPSNDGLRLVRYVREVMPHTRVVVMAAFLSPDMRQHAYAAGADICLDKPFRLQQLWDVVEQILGM